MSGSDVINRRVAETRDHTKIKTKRSYYMYTLVTGKELGQLRDAFSLIDEDRKLLPFPIRTVLNRKWAMTQGEAHAFSTSTTGRAMRGEIDASFITSIPRIRLHASRERFAQDVRASED